MQIATRNSWKVIPLSDKAVQLPLEKEFNVIEFEKLKMGRIPQQMEDKWFIFFEENWLYFHRSWTGYGILKVKFEQQKEKYITTEFWVERNKETYSGDDNDAFYLVNALLQGMTEN